MVSAALALVGVVGAILYHGHTTTPGWVGTSDKKFWDYLELLIVPAAIAIGATALNWMQSERARKAEDAQQERERVAEQASRERELEVESQRAQDEALQAYLDQMSQLLINKERPLRRARPSDNLSTVARARTLTALTRLDASRKRSVLQFLYESGLVIKGHVVVDLWGADLSKARLSRIYLREAYLSEADMNAARLNAADLRGIDLSEADLSEADLSAANLHEADLRGADLIRADMSAANLLKADLREADLRRAYLRAATMHEADLSGIDLRGADLSTASLHRANLKGADLSGADLSGANLREADLTNATMPNGQKYEKWLNTPEGRQWIKTYKEGRGEDGGNATLRSGL